MKKLFLTAALLLPVLALVPTLAVGTRVLAYSSPGAPGGFINDFAGILTAEQKASLEQRLADFTKETGHELAVVTVANLGGDAIENYAVKLFAEWGIGREKEDNGVLLLVARDDRQVRIEVGYGLEGALTDAQSYWIIQEQILPAFKAGDYFAGIEAGVNKIMGAARGEVLPAASESKMSGEDWAGLGWFIFIILMWLASILARSKSWWAGGVVGGVLGVIVGFIWGFIYFGLAALIILIPLGLFLDFLVSRAYSRSKASGINPPWWAGGGGFGHGGGGFGGFGGGMSGGGGASGSW